MCVCKCVCVCGVCVCVCVCGVCVCACVCLCPTMEEVHSWLLALSSTLETEGTLANFCLRDFGASSPCIPTNHAGVCMVLECGCLCLCLCLCPSVCACVCVCVCVGV